MDERSFNYFLKNIHKKQCFDKLYDFYYRRIVLHINRRFNMGTLSEDVAQECFMKLLEKKDFKHIEYYTSWIYKICENIALRKLNQETIERKKLQSEENGFIEESDLAIFGSLQESVEKLDKDSQAIFYLHYVESYRLKEIAEKYGCRYLDCNEALVDEHGEQKSEYAIDGVHMYANGYLNVFKFLKPYL